MTTLINLILSIFIAFSSAGAEVRGDIPQRSIEYKEVCISTECNSMNGEKIPLDPYYRRPKLPKTVIS